MERTQDDGVGHSEVSAALAGMVWKDDAEHPLAELCDQYRAWVHLLLDLLDRHTVPGQDPMVDELLARPAPRPSTD
jgi:hypothetical protein